MSRQEEHIIKMLWRQEKEAISILYDQYSSSLYGIALRIFQSEEEAGDVVKEVFVKAWDNACRYDPTTSTLFSWLFDIMRSRAIGKMRSK